MPLQRNVQRGAFDLARRRSLALGLGSLLIHSDVATATRQKALRSGGANTRFLVYYGPLEQAALRDYDILVLDAEADETGLRSQAPGATKLGYLSACELDMGRPYAPELAAQGLVLFENTRWVDARFVDVRDPRWTAHVLERQVPALLERGFDGIFIDTLDDPEHLELLDRVRFAGMRGAAVALVREIRRRNPNVPIMVNRGYAILPLVLGFIDMVMGESVRSTFDAAQDRYTLVSEDTYRWQRDRLREAKLLRSSVRLFSLDYWSADDPVGIARLHAQARADGFASCVATFDLQRIVPEA